MRYFYKFILVCLLCFLTIAVLYIGGILGYATLTEFKPEKVENISLPDLKTKMIEKNDTISIFSWNIGYAGLGKEMDFFYEGGTMVSPTEEQNNRYLKGILKTIIEQDTIDFFLFQEIDFESSRSYGTNQYELIAQKLEAYHGQRVINYKSAYVPVPFLDPMGKVRAGMATFSKYAPLEAKRIATPGRYPWPSRIFMLKRCFLKTVYPLTNGKQFIIYNIHNSAFDDAAELREQELEFLKSIILQEFEKGNYIVVGGDWNQNPPQWKSGKDTKYILKEVWPINKEFLPGEWNWHFEPNIPTNRDVATAFDIQQTKCSVIDFFVTSPNITGIDSETLDLGFENSDHHPVVLTIKFK